jgi:hypothetical protein
MFVEAVASVQQTMIRLSRHLDTVDIPYAVIGGMAVGLHGARSFCYDLGILLTSDGLNRFREECVSELYEPVRDRSRRFVDRQSRVPIEVFLTGHCPGRVGPKPITFPDPGMASEEIGKIRVVSLPQLIQLKLAAGAYYDLGEVVLLIRHCQLNEAFLAKLHPLVHGDFLACLDEMRREDDFDTCED